MPGTAQYVSTLKEQHPLGTLMAEVSGNAAGRCGDYQGQKVLGGTPVFRGTRVPFQALLDYLEGGQNLEEFLDDFPTVTREAAVAALELAKSSLVSQLE